MGVSYNGADPAATEPNNNTETQHQYTLSVDETVSVPGLSTFLDECSDAVRNPPPNPLGKRWNTGDYNWDESVPESEYTAGIDCSGFVWRSLKYVGNNYSIAGKIGSVEFNDDSVGTLIADGAQYSALPNTVIDALKYAVPGDYLVYPGHIAIVQQIEPNADGAVTRRNQIKIIHAVSGVGNVANFTYQVLNDGNWDSVEGLGNLDWWKYKVRRLK